MADSKDAGADVDVVNFVGKTIVDMDISAVNEVVFHFSDGSIAALEVIAILPTQNLYGIAECAKGTSGHRKKGNGKNRQASTETF